jgi:hypothetical protein
LEDLRIAKKHLVEEGLTLSIVKDGCVLFETGSHGISGLLRAIQEVGERLRGASVADKVVGRAIALLCLFAGVGGVYGSVMSGAAEELFEENGVHAEWAELIGSVLDECKSATCPFERLAGGISDPEEAYKKLKALQDSLKHGRLGDKVGKRGV